MGTGPPTLTTTTPRLLMLAGLAAQSADEGVPNASADYAREPGNRRKLHFPYSCRGTEARAVQARKKVSFGLELAGRGLLTTHQRLAGQSHTGISCIIRASDAGGHLRAAAGGVQEQQTGCQRDCSRPRFSSFCQ